ncbi:hypothetical protein B296_00000531 [Ensete ventricosum]|uniref:Uncharacterized protein n=1 Tax=Ensete ventricosum TaxID=4639 RepID=A0A426ZMU9_ENSVE|nr:hypothetical protein B296_00000531 [Ensete ventricosum]
MLLLQFLSPGYKKNDSTKTLEDKNHSRPTTYKPPSIPSHSSLSKIFTREELRDRLAKGLCWYCDEPWSHDHRYKKGRLLLIEPLEDVEEEVQEHKVEVTDEEEQPVDITMHALAGYANPQTMKIGGFLKQQLITILIDTRSPKLTSKSEPKSNRIRKIQVQAVHPPALGGSIAKSTQIPGYGQFNRLAWAGQPPQKLGR